MRLLAVVLAALSLAACGGLPTIADVQAHKHPASTEAPVAPRAPSQSGSACADLYITASTGKSAPGVLQCLSADYRHQWAGAGVTTDEAFATQIGDWTHMTGWTFVGPDVKGHLVYDLFDKKGTVIIFVVYLDANGYVTDNVYFAYQG